jgi:hypothetical protein
MTAKPAWREYEEEIEARLRRAVTEDAQVSFDVKLRGKKSGTLRQVDILIEGNFAGLESTQGVLVVDCKHYTSNLDVNDVGAFISLVEDVGADHGLMVTSSGYSQAAAALADNTRGVHLDVVERAALIPVDIVTTQELDEGFRVYHPSHDEPYYAQGSYDGEPYGPSGTNILFAASDLDSEILAADVACDTPAGIRDCARVVLRHHLRREPEDDLVETFARELGWKFSRDPEWVVWQGELQWAW